MPYEIKILDILDSDLESNFLVLARNTMGQGPDEILPGIVCEAAGGHTEGSIDPVSGPEQPVERKTTADTHEMGLGAGRLWV